MSGYNILSVEPDNQEFKDVVESLLPCPFCGCDAILTYSPEEHRFDSHFRIECSNRWKGCPVNMRTIHCKTPQRAAELWNTRSASI